MEVDGALVDGRVGALLFDETQEGPGREVDDREGVRRCGAEAEAACRVVPSGPDEAVVLSAEIRKLRRALERLRAECLGVLLVERGLEGSRADMSVEDARVRVVEDRRLDPPVEQRLRVAHEELVECVLRGDHRGEPVPTAPGAAPLLPEARDGSREADADDGVEEADVDPELERVRRADPEQVSLDEPALDLPPLRWGVAGAVRGQARGVAEALGGEAMDELRGLAALCETERPHSSSVSGGFQRRIVRSAFGAPSCSIVVASTPRSRGASSPGFAIVAEASRNCGSAP